jgi:hypothetical protein
LIKKLYEPPLLAREGETMYGTISRVAAPIEMYDGIHAAILSRAGADIDGLLVHLARPSPQGFEVIEVWETREDMERYERDVVGPLLAQAPAGDSDAEWAQVEEFEVRGLVIPRGGIAL